MKITFLGTGAADFSPLLETEFQNKLDNDARRSSSVLLDDSILIDCGPHTLNSIELLGVDCAKITDLLITHFHNDHFNRENILRLAQKCPQPLRMWYHADGKPGPMENVQLHPIRPLESFQTDLFQAKALPANHTSCPLHYHIEIGSRKLFYGCDGAWLLNETFYAMMNQVYTCMILDGTVGDFNGDYRLAEHNSIPMIRLMTESFRTQNVIAPDGILCISHLARTLHKSHEETTGKLHKEGYTVAFDGMCLEFP